MEVVGPELPVEIGEIVADKYRVERLVGRGGMGCVFQATHTQLLQRVALKFLSKSMLKREDARARFLREARAAAALTTEHVARVLDVGVLPSGVPYLVIEYLEGEDLATRLERGVFGVEEAVKLMMQACDALGEAHRLGIVHRDVKPHNLFLVKRPNGSISLKVLDFGIAKVDDPNLNVDVITGTCAIMGTPQYMAPEQMTSTRNVDPAADVWALGVCLYECLTNRRPFESSNMLELGALVMNGSPSAINTHRADLPPSLVAVIERCLTKDPARRYPDANALNEALASSQEKAAIVVAPPTMMTPHFATGMAPVPRGSAPPPAMHSVTPGTAPMMRTPATPGTPRTPATPGTPVTPGAPSPRNSTPPLFTATSFGDPGGVEARPISAEPQRPSSKSSTAIVVALLTFVVALAVGVKIARRSGDASPTTAAKPPSAALVAPPPETAPAAPATASPSTVVTSPAQPQPVVTITPAPASAPAAAGPTKVRHPIVTNGRTRPPSGTPATNSATAPTATAAPAER